VFLNICVTEKMSSTVTPLKRKANPVLPFSPKRKKTQILPQLVNRKKQTSTKSTVEKVSTVSWEKSFAERYHCIDPRDRFKCQQKLYGAVCGCINNSFGITDQELTQSWITNYNHLIAQYCRQAEQTVYRNFYNDFAQYQSKIKQLLFNLYKNGKFLTQKYAPETVVALDDGLLSEGTEEEQARMQYEQKVRAWSSIIENRDIFKNSEFKALLRCRFCKCEDIASVPKQTRSADEGMTIFCTCNNPKCGAKWKI